MLHFLVIASVLGRPTFFDAAQVATEDSTVRTRVCLFGEGACARSTCQYV